MFHRIEPAIPQMRRMILVMADMMFPEPALPDAAFLPGDMAAA